MPTSTRLVTEDNVQEALANYYRNQNCSVVREYSTPVGYIDLLVASNSRKLIIEVKEYSGIKHAIGQILCYKEYIPGYTDLLIITFSKDCKYKKIKPCYANNPYHIYIKSINEIVDTNTLLATANHHSQEEDILPCITMI